MTVRRLVPLVVLALAAASCASGTKVSSSPSPTASRRPGSSAQLSITSPRNGETVKGPTLRVVASLIGGTIVPQTTTALRPDEGHIHVKLDGRLQSLTAGTTFDLSDVKPGAHVVQIEFVAADHAPFDPRVTVGVSFLVS